MPRPDFLREGFGTIGFPGWEEIDVPEAVSMAPQTVGWWVLVAVVVVLTAWAVARWVRRYRANRYRRSALRELRALRADSPVPGALKALPSLLKRTALAAYPREEVASLTGGPWASFLARTCPGADFEGELGAVLERLSYRDPETVPPNTARRLLDAAEIWIRGHHVEV